VETWFRLFLWAALLFLLVQGLGALYLGEIKAGDSLVVRRSDPARFRRESFLHFLALAILLAGMSATSGPDPHHRGMAWLMVALFLPLLLRDLGEGRSSFGPLVTREEEPIDYWVRIGVISIFVAMSLIGATAGP
jgi:hypothetical protein